MGLSTEWVGQTSNELHTLSSTLVRIARTLHEHTQKLEIVVEGGKLVGGNGEEAARWLSDSLHVSRMADIELGRLSMSLQRIAALVQKQSPASTLPELSSGAGAFERERAALTINITDLRKQRDELETLYEIARVLNSTLEFDEVLRLVMDRVIEFVDAERGFLVLVNPDSGALEFSIARDKEKRTIPVAPFANAEISRSTVKRVIETRVPKLADDAQSDSTLSGQQSIMAFGIRSIMCAPLVVRDHCIGAVYVDSRVSANLFGPRHLDLLLAFCNQAAIAIDNARLFSQVRADKQYMDNIFSSIANGVITTDVNGIITAFNGAAGHILAMNPEQARGKHFEEAFKPLAHVRLIELLRMAPVQHAHGTIVNQAFSGEIPGRGQVNLSFYISALRDLDGAPIGIALVVDDRTELKRAEARAREVRRIFERFVHPSVVQQLIQNPAALNLGGETKEISVVFADIRGYTRLSEHLAPEEVMNLINRYLAIMCEAIWEEEGTLTAFQGDALMAIFNAPLPQSSHALRAVRADWKMRMAVLEYQRSRPQEMPVSFGFGVNTGLATVGNVGSQGHLQNYTAIGDAVNVASRLQNSVSDNNVLLNDTTYMQVQQWVQAGKPFQLSVKNRAMPLTVRYLFGIN
ncbi:MAG: GAF domain-containing protein [Ktedonobacteraceae bacterium]|nr:GAF domain-containing protein [Ktedonobacteraceae bacterium]